MRRVGKYFGMDIYSDPEMSPNKIELRNTMTRFADDRAPLELTSLSTIQIIRVCPHCQAPNQVSKTWYAGKCRGCKRHFNRDQALTDEQAVGPVHSNPETAAPLDNVGFVNLKDKAEARAHEWKDRLERDGHPGYDFGHITDED